MPDPHWCPVENCAFGVDEDRPLGSVRSHINAETLAGLMAEYHRRHRG